MEKQVKSETFLCDNMDFLRKCPDKKYDVGIVDPEYLNQSENKEFKAGGRMVKAVGFGDFSGKPTEEYFYHLFRCTKHQIIFGGNYFTDIMDYSSYIDSNNPRDVKPYLSSNNNWFVWYKQFADAKWSMAELAWVSFDKSIRVHREFPMNNVADWHPTSKPVGVYKYLIETYLKKGMSILDTNLGSGSIRRAAYSLGHPFTGLEISEKFYNLEKRDFEEYIKSYNLFINNSESNLDSANTFNFNIDEL